MRLFNSPEPFVHPALHDKTHRPCHCHHTCQLRSKPKPGHLPPGSPYGKWKGRRRLQPRPVSYCCRNLKLILSGGQMPEDCRPLAVSLNPITIPANEAVPEMNLLGRG